MEMWDRASASTARSDEAVLPFRCGCRSAQMLPLWAVLFGYTPESHTVLLGHDQSFEPLLQLLDLVATHFTLKDPLLHPQTVALQQLGMFAAAAIAGGVIGSHLNLAA